MTGPRLPDSAGPDTAESIATDVAHLLAGVADLPLAQATARFAAVHARLNAALAEQDRS